MLRAVGAHAVWGVSHLDDGEHSLVIVQVGVDLKAAGGIPLDDGVDGSPGARGRVVPVVDRQVDHHTRRALVDKRLELRGVVGGKRGHQ